MSDTRSRLSDALQYVEKLIGLGQRIVLDIEAHKPVHEHVAIGLPGVHADGELDGVRSWLRVERLQKRSAPLPSDSILAWLDIDAASLRRPVIRDMIIHTVSADDGKNLLDSGVVQKTDIRENLKDPELVDVFYYIDRNNHIRDELTQYIAERWEPWAKEESRRRRTIQQVYDRLYDFSQQTRHEGAEAPHEIVMMIGLARQRVGDQVVQVGVIEQPVEVELAPDASLHVRPRDVPPLLGVRAFEQIDVAQTDELARSMRRYVDRNLEEDRDLHPLDTESYASILSDAAVHLSKNGQYLGHIRDDLSDRTMPPISDDLLVTDTWAIVFRPRTDSFLSEDIRKFREVLKSIEPSAIPDAVARVVEKVKASSASGEEANIAKMLAGRAAFRGASDSLSIAGGDRAELSTPSDPNKDDEFKLFYPRPSNEQQRAIVKALESDGDDGMVVQGPPGTGKSHTIANIICHFLATGRRVLVTSKGERALAVLQEKLPNEVRPLTVSLLSNDQAGLRQIEQAVHHLGERVQNADRNHLKSQIFDTNDELETVERRLVALDEQIRRFARGHLMEPPSFLASSVGGRSNEDLARWLSAEASQHEWFTDNPKVGSWPLDPTLVEAISLAVVARIRLGEKLKDIGRSAPKREELPDAISIAQVHNDLAAATEIEHRQKTGDLIRMSRSMPDAVERARQLYGALKDLTSYISNPRFQWLRTKVMEWQSTDFRAENEVIGRIVTEIRSVLEAEAELFSSTFEGVPHERADEVLMMGVARAAAGKRPFGLFGDKDAKGKFARIRVNGEEPTRDQWSKVHAVFQAQIRAAAIRERWNVLAGSRGFPLLLAGNENQPVVALAELMKALREQIEEPFRRTVEIIRNTIPILEADLSNVFPSAPSVAALIVDEVRTRDLMEMIRLNIARESLSKSRTQVKEWRAITTKHTSDIAKRIRSFITEELGSADETSADMADRWDHILDELRVFHDLASDFAAVDNGYLALGAAGAPNLASHLIEPISVSGPFPERWQEAWLTSVVDTYLDTMDPRGQLLRLSMARGDADRRRGQLLERLVSLGTEYALAVKIHENPSLSSALSKFASAIRKIGRGTGIRAPRHRRAAKQAMLEAHAGVPCWIMPEWRVSEILPAEIGSFDLVIFDEASQSDIRALPVLMRGRKILVVGDDKQVSPSDVGLEERSIRQFRHTFLSAMPHGDLMLPGSSLYELASAIYPGKRTMLVEHFRCVESIIGFSQRFYSADPRQPMIRPVRIPKISERLDPPLIDVFIEDGERDRSRMNRGEAHFVVQEIEKIVKDPDMKGRTIGVISLVSNKQAHLIQKMLIDRLGTEIFEEFRISCGDSATFQGDERSIMFLSMVHSPGACQSLTGLTFDQRFNVAMSRAQDRVYLVRSIGREHVRAGSLQHQLIEYVANPIGARPPATENLRDLCESGFEEEVYDRLIELGYRVIPQVKSGPYRIDLVVEGAADRRIAIELDGDKYHTPERWFEDFSRQQVLERVGWVFWRCFASTWWRDPKGMLQELVATLRDHGIDPHIDFGEAALSRVVEHRTWRLHESVCEVAPAAFKSGPIGSLEVGLPPGSPTYPVHGRSEQRTTYSVGRPDIPLQAATENPSVELRPTQLPLRLADEQTVDVEPNETMERLEPTTSIEMGQIAGSAATDTWPAEAWGEDFEVEVGDTVQIQLNASGRTYQITISMTDHNPEDRIFKVGHHTAEAILGLSIDDVFSLPTPGGAEQEATIVGIIKPERVAA